MNPETAKSNADSEIIINLTRNTGYKQIKYSVSRPDDSFAAKGAIYEYHADLIDSLSKYIPQDFKGEVRVKSEYCPGMYMGKYDEFLSADEVRNIRQQLQKTRSDIRIVLST